MSFVWCSHCGIDTAPGETTYQESIWDSNDYAGYEDATLIQEVMMDKSFTWVS